MVPKIMIPQSFVEGLNNIIHLDSGFQYMPNKFTLGP